MAFVLFLLTVISCLWYPTGAKITHYVDMQDLSEKISIHRANQSQETRGTEISQQYASASKATESDHVRLVFTLTVPGHANASTSTRSSFRLHRRTKRGFIGALCGAALGSLAGITYSSDRGFGYNGDRGLSRAGVGATLGGLSPWRLKRSTKAMVYCQVMEASFVAADMDKDNALSFSEIQLGDGVNETNAQALFKAKDKNGDQLLQPKEVNPCLSKDTNYHIRQKRCDEDEGGYQPHEEETYVIMD